jgi:hypothetical protein
MCLHVHVRAFVFMHQCVPASLLRLAGWMPGCDLFFGYPTLYTCFTPALHLLYTCIFLGVIVCSSSAAVAHYKNLHWNRRARGAGPQPRSQGRFDIAWNRTRTGSGVSSDATT